jgi:NADH dehydrogenase
LASAPLGVVFGSGQVKVQPIAVLDVARVLIATAQRHSLGATEFEVGGPEVLPIEDLIRRIRTIVRGGSERLVHVPLEPLRTILTALERILGSILPVTAGQLASFANDGTAAPHPWVEPFNAQMQPIDAMLRESLRGG